MPRGRVWIALLLTGFVCAGAAGAAVAAEPLDEAAATRFAHLALVCLHKEYPNKISHVMSSNLDAQPPHVLTPAFYGCFDWHSAVHGHWLLVRLVRLFPDAPFAKEARAALAESLTPKNVAGEVDYVLHEDRVSFERPYGLAWLLRLSRCCELPRSPARRSRRRSTRPSPRR